MSALAESTFQDGKYEPPVTITTARGLGGNVRFKEGEDIQNNASTKWALDTFGIDFQHLWTVTEVNNAFETKIRLISASNEPFPDMLRVSGSLARDRMETGRFLAMDEAIENYALDHLKKLYADFPEAFYNITVDGQRYGLPVFTQGNGSDTLMWIRKDWLDTLGLEAPTTIEELEAVMDAFVHMDPDRNGLNDTIGLSLALRNSIMNWMCDGSFLVGTYGGKVGQGQWGIDENDTMYYGGIQPAMKSALGTLSDWFKKGYLDQQVSILDESKAVESFISGKSGIVFGPPWMATWPFQDLIAIDPNAIVEPYPVPAGADGSIGRYGEMVVQASIMFDKDFAYIEGYMAYLDTILRRELRR